jgi:hypothetical protein
MRILKYKKTDRARSKGQKRHARNAERVTMHVTTGSGATTRGTSARWSGSTGRPAAWWSRERTS